jgi:RNA polymerase subunit RPABC4/transcription elongation factor Spt4
MALTDVYPLTTTRGYHRLLLAGCEYARCAGVTSYGDPCRRYANGRLDGEFVCSSHFKPVKPKKKPSPDQLEARRSRKLLALVTVLVDADEDQCPVCLSDYTPEAASICGHKACVTCLRGMKAAKLACTRLCPLCRDPRFKDLIEWAS